MIYADFAKVLIRRVCAGRKGQTTVEYLLMLAVVVGMTLAFGLIFYKHMLKLFYIMVGLSVGGVTPT